MGLTVKWIFLFIDAISTLIGISNHPGKYNSPVSTWLAQINFNLFKCGNITNQPKELIPLFVDQAKRTNFTDYLTKYDLIKDHSEMWLEFQWRILCPNWLQLHPKFWIDSVILESAQKISKQVAGMKIPDFCTSNSKNVDPTPISITHVGINQKMDPNMCSFPPRDWYLVEAVVRQHMSQPPKVTFKIIGWICMIFSKWRDIVLVKKWKSSLGREKCFHPNIFCRCSIEYLKKTKNMTDHFPMTLMWSGNRVILYRCPQTKNTC